MCVCDTCLCVSVCVCVFVLVVFILLLFVCFFDYFFVQRFAHNMRMPFDKKEKGLACCCCILLLVARDLLHEMLCLLTSTTEVCTQHENAFPREKLKKKRLFFALVSST